MIRSQSTFDVKIRPVGVGFGISLKVKRGQWESTSAEKVVPPTLMYWGDGTYRMITLEDILKEWKPARYTPRSKDFNKDRIADAEASSLFNLLENYPTLEQEPYTKQPHPLAEIIYGSIIYQCPSEEFAEELKNMDVISAGKAQALALEAATQNVKKDLGLNIDQYTVVKKSVAATAYIADESGFGIIPKVMALGMYRAIPLDRIARELGQFKSAERFINPNPFPFKAPKILKPYLTGLRVAVVWTEESMLDSGDLYPSSIPKLAAHISKTVEVKDWSVIPEKDRNLKARVHHAGIELIHVKHEVQDEEQLGFPCLKLLLPGAVKVAAQLQENLQAVCDGEPVDLLLDMRTISAKGAIALLAMLNPEELSKYPEPTVEDCYAVWNSMKEKHVEVGDRVFTGWVGVLPVMRTRQRYTELSKAHSHIGRDLVSTAMLNLPLTVEKHMEEDYRDLKIFRQKVERTLELLCTATTS